MKRLVTLLLSLLMLVPAGTAAQSGEAYDSIQKANDLAREGAITRSIPFYEKGLKLAPLDYTLAYFNLAEVWRAKGRKDTAGFYYALYLRHGSDDETLKQARQALKEIQDDDWGTLTVTGSPIEESTITIDGYLLARGDEVVDFPIPPGDYTVTVEAIDHVGFREKIEIEKGEDEAVTYGLEKMTFYGTVKINADVEGAVVKIHAGPSEETRVIHETAAPMTEAFKVEEGKHFVEITAPDHRRWIRNVVVGRDADIVIDATLTKALPKEIRRDN